jgi:catechol 2,3-dioxygenase-like lactoylglutathione lyase family enzyme
MRIVRIDHVQVAIPAGGEPAAREFYGQLLGIPEKAKPANLAARGGVWFEAGELKLHAGVERDFQPARKAHPALIVEDLPGLIERLRAAGVSVVSDEPLEGFERVFVSDPFGNRVELLEPV